MRKFRDKDLQEWVDMLRKRSENWRDGHHRGVLGFCYWGKVGKEDRVYLFGCNDSYSALYTRAMVEHVRNQFCKIKNLDWSTGSYSGYGEGQWLEMGITESTTKALKEAYEVLHDDRGRSYLTADGQDSESFVYDAMDTEEYQEMEDKESWECYKNWLKWDVLHGTPYGDMPESYYKWFENFIYQEESGGGYIYNQGDSVIELALMPVILEALNKGDLEIDQEEYNDWVVKAEAAATEKKPFLWPRIAQGTDGKWYLESELTWVNDEWVLPFKTETKRMFDDE